MMHFSGRMLTAACVLCAAAGCGYNGKVATSTPTAPTTPTVTAKFAYTGNQGESVSGYSVDPSTGALTPLAGFPLTLGLNPIAVAVDPQSRFLFVGDVAAGALHVLSINSSTGALSEIATSPYSTVNEPVAIVVDPSGTHVYVSSQGSNAIGAFNLGASGALTPIAGSPFAIPGTQNYGNDLVMNAAGTFVYVQTPGSLSTFSVTASSGALALVQNIPGPPGAGGIALDPAEAYLYAVGPGTDLIEAYSIDASIGVLTEATSSPMVEPNGAYTISVSPSGKFAYTIENNNDLVSYAVANGKFTAVGSVYPQVYGEKIGIDPSSSFVYVPQACSNCPSGVYNVINEFSVGSTGALTKIPGSPAVAGVTPWGIAFTTQ